MKIKTPEGYEIEDVTEEFLIRLLGKKHKTVEKRGTRGPYKKRRHRRKNISSMKRWKKRDDELLEKTFIQHGRDIRILMFNFPHRSRSSILQRLNKVIIKRS